MNKVIIEVGSTVTKIYQYNGQTIKDLGFLTIQFKNNYKLSNKLDQKDIDTLISKIEELKSLANDILVLGTSIFRELNETEKREFLKEFRKRTQVDFEIISQEEENELTVYGAVRNVKQKVAVFIGGGGSTEISIYDHEILEMVNSKIGVIDILNIYPDLADDFAATDIEIVKEKIKEKLNIPDQKADILILSGGGHKKFALESGITYEKNILYKDDIQPIMMTIENRIKDSDDYYKKISLDEIRNQSNDPKWWNATRPMCAFVLVVAQKIGAKYIVPTDISMIYGIINKLENKSNI